MLAGMSRTDIRRIRSKKSNESGELDGTLAIDASYGVKSIAGLWNIDFSQLDWSRHVVIYLQVLQKGIKPPLECHGNGRSLHTDGYIPSR